MMKEYGLHQILKKIKEEFTLKGSVKNKYIDNANTLQSANSKSIVWIKPNTKTPDLLEETLAETVICNKRVQLSESILGRKCFIIVDDPKLTFLRIVDLLFAYPKKFGIHPSAVIHPNAKIHKQVGIGPNTIIGNSSIDRGTIISGNCNIGDNIKIGKNVFINPGAVIGSEGFGYSRNKEGYWEKFPHLGGVIIGDNVDIGANTCIDRGTLSDTIICNGVKIDNLVHIAHNVVIGKNSLIIANALIAGSTQIGEGCWVSPSASIINGVKIGKESTIGIGSMITTDVPDGETWSGFPSRPLKEVVDMEVKLKELLFKKARHK